MVIYLILWYFMVIKLDLMGFYGDLMGFNVIDLMRFYAGLLGFNCD
jgi:hypothetical protein